MTAINLLAQVSNNNNTGFAIGGAFMIVFILIAIAASLFWLWMLVDCLTSSMPTNEKLLWFLVIFFLHLIGALIYFTIRKSAGPAA